MLGALVAVRAVRKVAFAAMSRGFPFPAACLFFRASWCTFTVIEHSLCWLGAK